MFITFAVSSVSVSANLIINPIIYQLLNATSVSFVYAVLAIVTIIIGLVTSMTFRERRDSDISDDVPSAEDMHTRSWNLEKRIASL